MLFWYKHNPPVYKAGLRQLLCACAVFSAVRYGSSVNVQDKIMTHLMKTNFLQTDWDCLCSILSITRGELQA